MTNIFNGVPIDTQAFSIFDATYYIFYKDYKYYIYNYATNTTSAGVAFGNGTSVMSQIPTGQTINMGYVDAPNSTIYINVGTNWYKYAWVLSSGIPTFTYVQTISNSSWFGGGMPTSGWDGLGPYTNGANMWLFNGSSYNQSAYGGTGQPFDGLPHDIGCIDIRIDDTLKGWAFKGDKYYEISLTYSGIGGGTALIGRRPNGGTLVSSGTIPPVVNIFNGVPWDHTASVSFDADPTITYFFRVDPSTNLNKVYIHDEVSNTTTVSDIGIPTMFPSVSTIYPIRMGGENLGGPNPDEHLICWIDTTIPNPNRITTVVTSPTAVVVQQFAQSDNLVYHEGQSIEQASTGNKWYAHFSFDRWLALRGSTQHFLSTGSYGAFGQPYAGLPYIGGGVGVETNYCSLLRVNGQENQMYLFTPTGDAIIMDLLAQQINSTVPYGPIGAPPPVVPPTPLPDIEVVYSAPSQFNLFSSDVALVTENQYGWNFTKTILTADKMELYNYFATAPGALPFNYNDLRDLRVTMKNNLALGSGNIFFNVYTVGTAGGWYGTKTTYFGTPALGTTIDTELVETIIPISDARTDQILAISIGSNSAQQQVNCDVERVSFEILLPATNETQRVIVKLQNNFIVVDDKYWDFDQVLNGYTNASLTGGWQLSDFTPNIVAGNFPQSVTAKTEVGNAWFIGGSFQYYETTDGTTWTASAGKTITFENTSSATPPPGKASNGYAYTGCNGIITHSSGWGATTFPIAWSIEASGQLNMVWVGKTADSYLSLSQLAPPNNFTLTDFQSGMFDANATPGSTAVGVFIGSTVSTAQQPTAPIAVNISVISETELTIKRSWELNTTTYLLNPGDTKSVLGQYSDPAFTTTLAPDTFTAPDDLVVVVEPCPSPIQLLFSGGFINTIDVSGTYNINVNAPPVGITYVWTANYYDVDNILISAVAGAGTSGTQSNFTIDLLTMPSNAKYVFYTCTSNEGASSVISIILIQPESDLKLTFQTANNQIITDGTYTVAPNPSQVVQFDAVFRDFAGASLGAVPGFGTSGTFSSFVITYATLPANVAWIDYECTDGTVIAKLSITIVPIEQPEPFILEFNALNNQIDIDGTYSVKPSPVDATTTYAYTAVFRDIAGTSLGAVPGAGTSGISSPFTITFATLPTGVKYIDYNATATGGAQDTSTAQLSITIIEPCPPLPPVPFILEFNSLNNQIDIDGTYNVTPSPIDPTTTYAYTAEYRNISGASLGVVPGIGTSGTSSSFTITYVTLPTGTKYIDYNATATGGAQDTSTAQLSITIIEPCPPIPPIPEDDDITLTLSTTGNIEYEQFNPTASLKLLTGDRLSTLKMTLVDSYGDTLHTDKPIYYECEIRSSITKE